MPKRRRNVARSAAPNSLNNNIVIVAGPTGSGKSDFAVGLATQLGGEIICGDAFQVYRGMSILTAQPTAVQIAAVPHHLYGCMDPSLPFDAASLATMANQCAEEINSRGKTPILVGGSGMYIEAVMGGLANLPPPDPELRRQIRSLPPDQALDQLSRHDPLAIGEIDTKNPRRVARALEIVMQTGRPLREARGRPGLTEAVSGVVITRDRDDLFARIETNVNRMVDRGVIDEVRHLGEIGPTASRAIGYPEFLAAGEGAISTGEAVRRVSLATRKYAKRQETWFRNRTRFKPIPASRDASMAVLAEQVGRWIREAHPQWKSPRHL